jgi:8-oxo-dGTP pyrophosphatase MutT (NUDIX family)
LTDAASAAVAIPLAATVLLLRETDAGLQVLMTKRAAGLSFMAGLWVFPGGRVEPADESPAVLERLDGLGPDVTARMRDRMGQQLPTPVTLAIHVAACRETFEESGVLLAHRRGGGSGLRDAAQLERLGRARQDAIEFGRLLEEEDLVLESGRLVYWSHWITPAIEAKRFDTRFFAIDVPADQVASVDRSELTQHAWLLESEVRENLQRGEMRMAPPTIATLQDLWARHAEHGSLAAMLAGERHRDVPTILPKARRLSDGEAEVLLPWDPEYEAVPGEGCAVLETYPEYLRALPSRRRHRR